MKRMIFIIFVIMCPLNSMADCKQLYLNTVKFTRGSTADCKQAWDSYKRDNDNFMLSLMALDGLGGQKADSQKALQYANKIAQGDGDAPDEIDALKAAIQRSIKKPSLLKTPVPYCSIVSSDNGEGLCERFRYEERNKQLEYDINHLAAKLNPAQALALNNLLASFQQFNADNYVSQDKDNMFQGTGAGAWSYRAQIKQISFFSKTLFFLIQNPNTFIKIHSGKKPYQSQLDTVYKKLVTLQKNADNPNKAIHALAKAQASWLKYQGAFLHFGTVFSGSTTADDKLKKAIKAALEKERLKSIQTQSEYLK